MTSTSIILDGLDMSHITNFKNEIHSHFCKVQALVGPSDVVALHQAPGTVK